LRTRWSTRRSETIWVRPGAAGCARLEFHLGHVFDKIGIHSRKDLAARLAAAR
jgi:hypothetical protein